MRCEGTDLPKKVSNATWHCVVCEPNWIRRAILIEVARAANVEARLCGLQDILLACPEPKAHEVANSACELWRKFERLQMHTLMELLDSFGLRIPREVLSHFECVETDVEVAWRNQPEVLEPNRDGQEGYAR